MFGGVPPPLKPRPPSGRGHMGERVLRKFSPFLGVSFYRAQACNPQEHDRMQDTRNPIHRPGFYNLPSRGE